MTLETLSDQHGQDMPHARYVADLALKLFDESQDLHELSHKARRLLEKGALLHTIGMHIDSSRYHIIGGDILLDTDLSDLDNNERAMVVCLVTFHRKKVRPEMEPAYLRLKKRDQQTVLQLTALLRVAEGLDYSRSQTTDIRTCKIKNGEVRIKLTGSHSAEDASRACKQSGLWKKALGTNLKITPETSSDGPSAPISEPAPSHTHDGDAESDVSEPEPPGLQHAAAQYVNPSAESTLTDVGRRLLRSNFKYFLEHEPITRDDEDPEGVHQMRVATRRLRAILQLLYEVAPLSQAQAHRKGLRRAARALSPVRDCDVFMEQVARYIEHLPQEEREGMAMLSDALMRDRVKARFDLLAYLDSKRYNDFKRGFAAFMTDEPHDWNRTLRIRDRLGSIIWQRYEDLRAHIDMVRTIDTNNLDSESEATLHETRIVGKRLRYALEVFEDVFDNQTKQSLKPLKQLQEHLGTLQDIAVVRAYIAQLDVAESARPAIDAYLASRMEERARLLHELPEHWEYILGEDYRRTLADVLIWL